MKEYEILIVEDDVHMRETWERDITDYNRRDDPKFTFSAIFATSKESAVKILSRTRVDCAVVDLRLPNDDGDAFASEPLGNDILQLILEEVGIPAVVYSGYDGDASANSRNSNIKFVGKSGAGGETILDLFASQSELMSAMEKTRLRISRETARLFNQSIWNRWGDRWSKEEDKAVIEEIIARQTASHIADALSIAPIHHHPDEFYIVPALHSSRPDTGDIIKKDNQVYVILTPRCNMANNPPSHITLAMCIEIPAWTAWKEALSGSSANKREKAERDIRNHATQAHENSSHFLPPLNGNGPWLVDFKETRSLKAEDVTSLLPQRIASIAPSFIPNLIQRYSSYLGRIGQPGIDAETLYKICKDHT
jgi:CheY-like chemotaxis protein